VFFDEQKGAGWCQKTSNNLHGHICMASCQVGHEQCRCGHAVDDVSRMLHCNPFLDTEDIGNRLISRSRYYEESHTLYGFAPSCQE